VWCAISASKVYGPYFFSETVNQHNYLTMLQDFFWKKQIKTPDYKKILFSAGWRNTTHSKHRAIMANQQIWGQVYQQENVATSFTRSKPMRLLSMGTSQSDSLQPFAKNNSSVASKHRERLSKT